MKTAIVALAVLAACDAPPLKIIYVPASSSSGASCGTNTCAEVAMECESVLDLRIVRPEAPNTLLAGMCEPVPAQEPGDLCAIGGIDLTPTELPKEILEVQVMVWSREALGATDGQKPDCLTNTVEFSGVGGFPTGRPANPAFGGRSFFHPGDLETVVTLGCIDTPSVNGAACRASEVTVTASVIDFDTHLPLISRMQANLLLVRAGEPRPEDGGHVFTGGEADSLDPVTDEGQKQVWAEDVDRRFIESACVEVNNGADTPTLSCQLVMKDPPKLDLLGVLLSREKLDLIIESALGLERVPPQGMTIGIVLDTDHNTPAGAEIRATHDNRENLSVQYLSDDLSSVVAGATATTRSGVFVSTDAPYRTRFTAKVNESQTVLGVGGQVAGKVTVVVLQAAPASVD